jgi:hypothetical protein
LLAIRLDRHGQFEPLPLLIHEHGIEAIGAHSRRLTRIKRP